MNGLLTQSLDSLSRIIDTVTDKSVSNFCTLQAAEVKEVENGVFEQTNAFASREGDYCTIMSVDGLSQMVDSETLTEKVSMITELLTGYLEQRGHLIQFHFVRDPLKSKRVAKNFVAHAERSAKAKSLDITNILQARAAKYERAFVEESLHLALWTTPDILSAPQLSQARRDKKNASEDENSASYLNTQNLHAGYHEILGAHESFVNAIRRVFEDIGYLCNVLSLSDASRSIHENIYTDEVDDGWKVVFAGEKSPVRHEFEITDNGVSPFLPPPISEQLFDRDVEFHDTEKYTTAIIGDRQFRSFEMTLAQDKTTPFDTLIQAVEGSNKQMPWRISFFLSSPDVGGLWFKKLISQLLWVTNRPHNYRIFSGISELSRQIEEGVPYAGVRCNISTWTHRGDDKRLHQQALDLKQCFMSWGGGRCTSVSGDPHLSALSSALGLSRDSTATTAYESLEETISHLPITRPAPAFKSGPVVFRTPDGLPMPYAPGSSEQVSWVELYYAPPRSGKSVTLNTINLGAAMMPSKEQYDAKLPFIAILDVGPSSKGFTILLQEALPPSRQNEVLYQKLQNQKSHAINVFDTQMGMREPLPIERSFLINFICQMCTPVDGKLDDMAPGVITALIDEVYNSKRDSGSDSNRYSTGVYPDIDEVLKNEGFQYSSSTSWWKAVDFLFDHDFIEEAAKAQRQAVPVLADLSSVINNTSFTEMYADVKTSQGSAILSYIKISLQTIARDYPIINACTALDLSSARVVALDMEAVCPSGPGTARKTRALMYMLGRYAVGKNMFVADNEGENVHLFPSLYQTFHAKRLLDLSQTPKRLVYDEFHRTSGAEFALAQLDLDMREGPKYGVQIALSSQRMEDFSPAIVEMATSIFIMRPGTGKQVIDDIAERFDINAQGKYIMRHRLTRPGPFLAVFVTKRGTFTNFMINDPSAIELWAYSTTLEDMSLRFCLHQAVGHKRALSILASAFPEGSAKPVIESMMDSGDFGDTKSNSVYDHLTKQLLTKFS